MAQTTDAINFGDLSGFYDQHMQDVVQPNANKGIPSEAICSTAGGTAAKVTNTTPSSFSLVAGAKIVVKFTYAITVANATLQVGESTAKPIYYKGAALGANLVKAGSSVLLHYDGTSFNIVGDLNTDTTYSVMGASGSTHASGLVPDTPSIAGTTKFLREDCTWQEPACSNYTAGDGIDISNDEISVDSTVALKTDLANEKQGNGIGTCSTSSGTALAVTLSGYELVQNGIVAVTFANDVPANANLNVNGKGAKPIIYKGSAITADTIKADDTVMFCYNGSQYVVTSLGGGAAAPVNPNETVNISLTQVGGNSADLIGASITITDDDSGDTLYTGTWAGTMLTTEIDASTNYTVSVSTITGYLACADKSYTAGYQTERNISFQYKGNGAYIEATDGTLYTSSGWDSTKTANSVVLITSSYKFRIAISQALNYQISNNGEIAYDMTAITIAANAKADMNGKQNTTNMLAKFNNSSYAAGYCNNFTFPDGSNNAYLPACGETELAYQNKTAINACLTACNGTALNAEIWTSTYYGIASGNNKGFWKFTFSNGNTERGVATGWTAAVLPFAAYE